MGKYARPGHLSDGGNHEATEKGDLTRIGDMTRSG